MSANPAQLPLTALPAVRTLPSGNAQEAPIIPGSNTLSIIANSYQAVRLPDVDEQSPVSGGAPHADYPHTVVYNCHVVGERADADPRNFLPTDAAPQYVDIGSQGSSMPQQALRQPPMQQLPAQQSDAPRMSSAVPSPMLTPMPVANSIPPSVTAAANTIPPRENSSPANPGFPSPDELKTAYPRNFGLEALGDRILGPASDPASGLGSGPKNGPGNGPGNAPSVANNSSGLVPRSPIDPIQAWLPMQGHLSEGTEVTSSVRLANALDAAPATSPSASVPPLPQPGVPQPPIPQPPSALPPTQGGSEVVRTPPPFGLDPSPAASTLVPEVDEGWPNATEPERPGYFERLWQTFWVGNTDEPDHDRGLGYERVEFAPFIIDTVRPMNQYGLRYDAAYNWRDPDLGELLMARSTAAGGLGPQTQTKLNYQDLDFVSEAGNSAASVKVVVPLRFIDGDTYNTSGLGDVQMSTKLVMIDGKKLKVAGYMGFTFPSGYAPNGLGTGHVTMEPGLLAEYRITDKTFLHAEGKFLFPIPPNADQQESNMLTWGFGLSHVLYDGDDFAIMPTMESVFYSVYNGGYNELSGATPTFISNEWVTVPTFHLGVRTVIDRCRDLGLIEIGLSTGFSMASNVWYEEFLRMELRVTF
jgi:hypothetical protein